MTLSMRISKHQQSDLTRTTTTVAQIVPLDKGEPSVGIRRRALLLHRPFLPQTVQSQVRSREGRSAIRSRQSELKNSFGRLLSGMSTVPSSLFGRPAPS